MFEIVENLYSKISTLPTKTLLTVIWSGFALIFFISVILSIKVSAVKNADKRPYLCLVNCFCALTFSACNITFDVGLSCFYTVAFWVVGYLSYGVLCLIKDRGGKSDIISGQSLNFIEERPSAKFVNSNTQPLKGNVRLEHALSVIENLLMRQLGKTDRLEVEKIKSTLSVLRLKGELTPAEGEFLNDSFNALLKLMAKYNV
jgi:hypothetical protein